MAIISLESVSKSYKKRMIFNNISLSIEQGKTIGIIGQNGCGKSVLFKIISGIESVDKGDVFVRNQKVGSNYDFPSNLGLLVNSPGYVDYYTGFENLKLLASIRGVIDDATISHYMNKVGLDYKDKTKVKNYSMGMKQKLGIAQAIMENQDIILLDEPFNALDFKTNQEITNIIYQLKKEQKTLVLTSHQHHYLEKLCDKIYIVIDHELVELTESLKNKYFM